MDEPKYSEKEIKAMNTPENDFLFHANPSCYISTTIIKAVWHLDSQEQDKS